MIAAAAYPFLGFAAENQGQAFDTGRLVSLAVATMVGALAVYVVATAARPTASPARLAVAVAVAVIWFFSYARWLDLLDAFNRAALQGALVRLVLWSLVGALLVAGAYRLARHAGLRTWLAATLVLLCVVSAATVALQAGGDPSQTAGSTESGLTPADAIRRPNIYFFLLDGYARQDVLREQTGADNGAFLDELRSRGMTVADEALTSYPLTVLSMASMFESDYPATTADELPADPNDLGRYIQGDNSTFRFLHDLGYTIVHADAGAFPFAHCDADHADVCISADDRAGASSELDITLTRLTPLSAFGLQRLPRNQPGYVYDQVVDAAPTQPFFVFGHILTPHWPYFFDDDCSPRADPLQYEHPATEEMRAAYANDVRCVDAAMLDVLDRLQRDDPDAVVILASDHGSEFAVDWEQPLEGWTDEALTERFAVLNALALPEACRGMVDDDTPLVHDFAIVRACLTGEAPELVDYRAFLWRDQHPGDIDEIDPARIGR